MVELKSYHRDTLHRALSLKNVKFLRYSVLKSRGRPPRDYVVSEQDKVAELKYILARKEAKIKTLKMENELLRDFLSLTERK